MKLIKYIFAVAVLTCALTLSAKADLSLIGVEAFPGNNSPTSNLTELGKFTDTTGLALCLNLENLSGDQTITVDPGEFLVVHYGKGSGGSAKGGSLEFFEVINGETSVTVPGFPDASDTFATGGISSIRGFCPGQVPDGGTTAALLGLGLTGVAGLRAKFGRN